MSDEGTAALANECAIAFGNLRASMLASAHLLAENNVGALATARELVADHLARGMQMPTGRPADLDAIARSLTALCDDASALLKANRRRASRERSEQLEKKLDINDETLAVAARRLDADLCIARGVLGSVRLRAGEQSEEGRERGERASCPAGSARRTG